MKLPNAVAVAAPHRVKPGAPAARGNRGAPPGPRRPPPSLPAAEIAGLQRLAGNAAVTRLLRAERYPPASILHGNTTTVLPPLQRFVDKEGDPKQVSESDIQAASLEKLKEWFGRENADWDSDEPTVPSASEKELIRARMQILEPAAKGSEAPKNPFADEEILPVGPTPEEIRDKAASELRKEIGLGLPQFAYLVPLFNPQDGQDKVVIRGCANTCSSKGWDLGAIGAALSGYDADTRRVALSVLGRGQVLSTAAITNLAAGWASMQGRDSISVDSLVNLINSKAVSVGRESGASSSGASSSGAYRISKLTGTADSAYAFYANGVQQTRIDPEWHVHVEESGTLKNPGFKKHADKRKTGPGTRRVTNPGESRALYAACQGPK